MQINQYFGLRCYDSCLIHIVEQQINPAYFFCKAFRIPWNEGELLGDKLKFDFQIKNLMVENLNLTSDSISINDFSLERCVYGQESYFIFEIDTFYISYHRLYQTEHTNHFCLFYKFDNEYLYVIDPMMSNEICKICLQEFKQGLLSIEKLHLCFKAFNKNRIICDAMNFYNNNNEITNYDYILSFISNSFDLQLEYEGLKIGKYEIPLYRSIWAIMFSRNLYSMFIGCLSIQNEQMITLLDELLAEWKTLRGMLAKSYFKGETKINKAAFEHLKKITEKEKMVRELNKSLMEKLKDEK